MATPSRRLAATLAALALPLGMSFCKGSTETKVAAGIAISPRSATLTSIGATQQFTAAVTDQSGSPLTGAKVTWASTATAVVTVDTTGLVTAVALGTAWIRASTAAVKDSVQVTVALPGVPTAVAKAAGDSQTTSAGATVPIAPAVKVTDDFGNAVPGVTVTFAVQSGGGSVTGATQKTSSLGVAKAGSWTLGPSAGTNTLSATVAASGITGNPVTFTATAVVPGAPAVVAPLVGNGQIGLVGYGVNVRPAVKVTDASGAPVSGVSVTFAVASGGGSATGGSATTNGNGIAQVTKWTLGASAGVNTMSATVTGSGIAGNPVTFADTGYTQGYIITITPYGAGLPPAAQTAFDSAVAKWQRIIYRPVDPVSLNNVTAGACDKGTPALSGTTTGLTIFASVDSIDGTGKILAEAGPCALRGDGLTAVGVMKFDSADIGSLISAGTLNAVVLHEMAHVIGFGTVWGPPQPIYGIVANCLFDTSTALSPQDTYFGCPFGQAAFDSVGGTSYTGASLTPPGGNIVPVENCGQSTRLLIGSEACGAGTINSHWRLPVFGNELMVGYLPSNPKLSIVTVAAQQDLGYTVNYDAADPYTHAFTAPAAAGVTRVFLGNDIRQGPIYVIDAAGHLTRVSKR